MPIDYSGDEDFNDPVVRCCDCQALITRDAIRDAGSCLKCGARRFRNVLNMTGGEHEALAASGIDPDYLALFEVRSSEGVIDVQ
jgi:hypothetical protein